MPRKSLYRELQPSDHEIAKVLGKGFARLFHRNGRPSLADPHRPCPSVMSLRKQAEVAAIGLVE